MEELSKAFEAALDSKSADACVAEAAGCLSAMRISQTGMLAQMLRGLGAAGRVLIWPLCAALGIAVIAVWQEISTYYLSKVIGRIVTDRELARRLGVALRESGLILPEDFIAVPKSVYVERSGIGGRDESTVLPRVPK